VKVLLDENFPLDLRRTLRADGLYADHVITLGWRGVPVSELRARVQDDDVIFLTHDTEFLSVDTGGRQILRQSVVWLREINSHE